MNQQELTELFCINKSVPQSKCNGKCYLNKKLKEADTTENTQSNYPVKQKVSVEDGWFCEQLLSINMLAISAETYPSIFKNRLLQQASIAIFHPPRG